MNRYEIIGSAALCVAAALWIGGAFSATASETTQADVEVIRRVAAAECYEITQLKVAPDHVFVEYVLRPTTSSYIRCQLAMPVTAAKWDGRLWGFGNGGSGGRVNVDVGVAKRGSVAVHTDMGTSKGVYGNREALIDFGWRSTHLMTVSAKKFATAYFGRAPTRCYFRGGSTGGGQGFHEALRFPDDYDGILSYVPANTRLPLHVYFAWNLRFLCDCDGKHVFSKEELSTVENAAIDYFADKDKPFARGRFLTDSRYTPEAEKGILELAKRKCPSLADGDKLERLHKLFTGPVLEGRRVHAGVPFSARLHSTAGWMLKWYLGPDRALHTVTDAELSAWLREWSPICDACGEGFAAFAKRGGKMIVVGGLEDSIVPYPSMIDWYERATKELGGRQNLEDACRLYLLPGRAHGRGRGCGNVLNDQRLLVEWVEKGVRPNDVTSDLKSGEKLTILPYPACFGHLHNSSITAHCRLESGFQVNTARNAGKGAWPEEKGCLSAMGKEKMTHTISPMLHENAFYGFYQAGETHTVENVADPSERMRLSVLKATGGGVTRSFVDVGVAGQDFGSFVQTTKRPPCAQTAIEKDGLLYLFFRGRREDMSSIWCYRNFDTRTGKLTDAATICTLDGHEFNGATARDAYNRTSGDHQKRTALANECTVKRFSDGWYYMIVCVGGDCVGLVVRSKNLRDWSSVTATPDLGKGPTMEHEIVELAPGKWFSAWRQEYLGSVWTAAYDVSTRTWSVPERVPDSIAVKPCLFAYRGKTYLATNLKGPVTTAGYGTAVRATLGVFEVSADGRIKKLQTIVNPTGCHYVGTTEDGAGNLYLCHSTDERKLDVTQCRSNISFFRFDP